MKIVVIGGSIAGCTIASLLQEKFEVTVFERATNLKSRGAGITMDPSLMHSLIDKGLLDKDLLTYPASTRTFHCKDPRKPKFGKSIWEQDIEVLGLHWDEIYKSGVKVESVSLNEDDASEVKLVDGQVLKFDLVIFADGIHSIGRQLLSQGSVLEYSGYVAWRGVIDFEQIEDKAPFINNIPYYCYDDGHLLAYAVNHGGEKKLNWVFYEKLSLEQLEALGSTRHAGFSDTATKHLHSLAKNKLPDSISQVVIDTPFPFMQQISDVSVSCTARHGAVLLGDASVVLRPHVGSGASLAISDALTLSHELLTNDNIDVAITKWQEKQLPGRIITYELSKRMGDDLVLNQFSWQKMTKAKMDDWWTAIIQGEKWYSKC